MTSVETKNQILNSRYNPCTNSMRKEVKFERNTNINDNKTNINNNNNLNSINNNESKNNAKISSTKNEEKVATEIIDSRNKNVPKENIIKRKHVIIIDSENNTKNDKEEQLNNNKKTELNKIKNHY